MTAPRKDAKQAAAAPVGRSYPVGLIADNRIAARTWSIVAAVAVLIALIEPAVILSITRQPEKAVIIGAGREVYEAPVVALQDTDAIVKFFAQEAAVALLSRASDVVSYPELLKTLYTENGQRSAKTLHDKTIDEIRGLHTHPEIRKIVVAEAGRDDKGRRQWAVTLAGDLLRQGRQGDADVADAIGFRLTLLLVRNVDLMKSGMVPYLVERLAYREIADNAEETR